MALQDQLQELQGKLPDFWTQQLGEGSFVQTLFLAYAYPYGSALQKWQTVANSTSPYTTEPYLTDYYKVIDYRNTVTPTDPALRSSGNFYFELPLNTFYIDKLSRTLEFYSSLTFAIYYDNTLKKTLLEVSSTQFISSDRYFYIREYHVDNGSMAKTWGALFPGLSVHLNTDIFPITTIHNSYGSYINSDVYAQYLLNVKAQIISFIKCANSQGSIDALESLISIVANEPYVTSDGIIVSYDSNNTWIEIDGSIVQFTVPPKLKFQRQNQPIKAYEAPGVCPVSFYSWCTNPNRFTQVLLQNNASKLFSLLSLKTNEIPLALYYDKDAVQLDSTINPYTFDFGTLVGQQVISPSVNYSTIENGSYDGFQNWSSPGISSTAYQFFKNVIVAETTNATINVDWLNNVLEYYRPLHCKYILINGGEGGIG